MRTKQLMAWYLEVKSCIIVKYECRYISELEGFICCLCFQGSGFSVSTLNGKIIVISDAGGDKVEIASTVNTYNDGAWHYVSIMKMGVK